LLQNRIELKGKFTGMKTAEEYYLQAIKELGFDGYKHSEMTNSDNHLCTIHAMKLYANKKLDEASRRVRNGAAFQEINSLKDKV